MRVPFFMQWPAAIKPDATTVREKKGTSREFGGIVSDLVVSHVDVFATIAAAASVGGQPLNTYSEKQSKKLGGNTSTAAGELINDTVRREEEDNSDVVVSNREVAENLLSEASQMASKFVENVTTVGSSIIKEHYALKLMKKLIKGVLFVYRETMNKKVEPIIQEDPEFTSRVHDNHLGHVDEIVDYFRNATQTFVNRTAQLLPQHVSRFNRRTRGKKGSTDGSASDEDHSSAHTGVHPEYMIDGINLLQHVASPLVYRHASHYESSDGILHSHYILPNNATASDRILFWRSGNYAAVQQPSTTYKLQVSEKLVNKIWFFHLGSDPYEYTNIAQQLGITTVEDLQRERTSEVSDPALKVHKKHLYALYDALLDLQTHQSKPLWPALIEFPTAIDKTAVEDEVEGDEYIYWAN